MQIVDLPELKHEMTAPVRRHDFGDQLSLEGFSRAGIQTYFRIPQFDILLDCGGMPYQFVSTPQLAITHGHPDHWSSLVSYLTLRSLQNMEPATVFIPPVLQDPIQRLLAAAGNMQGNPIDCVLHPLGMGEKAPIGHKRWLRPIPTAHTLPSQGYAVGETRHHLLPEYAGLSSSQIADLRRRGETFQKEVDYVRLAFTGDTNADALQHPDFQNAEILICELSFLEPDHRTNAKSHGHCHVEEVAEVLADFQGKHLVLSHISMRYSAPQAARLIEEALPASLRSRTLIWL